MASKSSDADTAGIATPEEVLALTELREELSDELTTRRSGPAAYLELVGGVRLLRFLQGHGTVAKAAEKYRAHLEWRDEAKIDAVREAIVASGLDKPDASQESLRKMETWPKYQEIVRYLPMNLRLEGSSRGGGPVDIQMCSSWDIAGFVKAVADEEVTPEEFLALFINHMEMTSIILDRASRQRGELVKVNV